MLETLFADLQNIYLISHYPISLYIGNKLLHHLSEYPSDNPLIRDTDLIRTLLCSQGIVNDASFGDIFYCVQQYTEGLTCILGPLTIYSVKADSHIAYLRAHRVQQFLQYQIITAAQAQAVAAMRLIALSFAAREILPLSPLPDFPQVSPSPISQPNKNSYWLQEYQLDKAEKELPTLPYRLEKEMMEALKRGDETTFLELLSKVQIYTSGVHATTPKKIAEYSAVAFITEMTRAIINGGVPYTDAYEVSDMMIYKLSNAKTVEEYNALAREACMCFLRLVKHNNSTHLQSPHVHNCKTYIMHHLSHPLTPASIAEALGISKDYLLHLFPKYEGMTLTKYIQKERIAATQNMLKYSDFDILRIANYYQFKTQSHFGVVFKKYTGMTPTAYRHTYKQPEFDNKHSI